MANVVQTKKTTVQVKVPVDTSKEPLKEVAKVTAGNDSNILTVVVLDEKSQPAPGARVSIVPSNASSVTDNSGEVQFKLGSATKYDITASIGSNTVVVPYYVTQNGATRLIVNVSYVKSVEKQLNKNPSTNFGLILGVGLATVVILLAVWGLLKRKKSKQSELDY